MQPKSPSDGQRIIDGLKDALVAAQCEHPRAERQHFGDGTPVDFCPDCGCNIWVGSPTEETDG